MHLLVIIVIISIALLSYIPVLCTYIKQKKNANKTNVFGVWLKKRKVPVAAVFSAFIIVAFFTGWYFTTHGSCGENVKWKLSVDGTLTISGNGDMHDFEWFGNKEFWPWRLRAKSVVVEEGVTSIGAGAFRQSFNLKSVVLPDTVTRIGALAFQYCPIETISLPDNLTYIGGRAFESCKNLKTVNIPKNVTHIGVSIFSGCTSVKTLYFDAIRCEQIASIADESNLSYAAQLFDWYGDAENFIIGPEVKIIPDRAFKGSDKLNSIVIPESVEIIGEEAFYNCENLKTVTIGDNITDIEYSAFCNCSNLTDVYYTGTKEQWEQIIIDKTNYGLLEAELHYNQSETILSDQQIPTENINVANTEITEPFLTHKNETKVQQTALNLKETSAKASTKKTEIKNSSKIIKSGTCGNSVNWTYYENGELVISGSGEMENYGFFEYTPWSDYASSIKSIRILNGVSNIGSDTFFDCRKCTEIIIPASVKKCSADFSLCYALKNVYFEGTVADWCEVEIKGTSQHPMSAADNFYINGKKVSEELTIPGGVHKIGNYAFYNCKNLTNLIISDGVSVIGDTAFRYSGVTNIVIPGSINTIERYAFADCPNLKSVKFSNGLRTIEKHAFYSCDNISAIVIPDSVTSMGEGAFESCSKLSSVKLGNGLRIIDKSLFSDCDSLTSIDINDGVTVIEEDAFWSCGNLKKVRIPESVTKINYGAFDWCTNLTDVYYSGTPSQWNSISIDSINDEVTEANIHYNSY